MRYFVVLTAALALTGCTAMMVGGAAAVGYQVGKDERTASVVAADSAITTKIKSKYVADSVVNAFNVSVKTWEGTVTLSGSVGSILARDRAVSIARETGGVKAVNDQIVIEDKSK